jgi:hypothetical protein
VRIIAIDPGIMTGYVYAELNETAGTVEYYPFQMTDEVDDLWRRLIKFEPRYIIIEDFEFRSRSRTGLVLFPVQLIGVTRLYELVAAPNGKCATFIQKAAQGKSYYTDNMLKALDLYKRGVPHGMDASRHLMQWLTFGAGYQYIQGNQKFATLLDNWAD